MPLKKSSYQTTIELLFTPGIGAHHSATIGESSLGCKLSLNFYNQKLDCIWEAGVGVLHSPPSDATLDTNRTELLRLLVTLASETLYQPSAKSGPVKGNTWVKLITRSKHSLSILASLINTICSYDPRFVLHNSTFRNAIFSGVPYHHLLFNDTREPLVEICSQLLAICLEKQEDEQIPDQIEDDQGNKFLFLISRLHREEDFQFIIKGITRLLNNPLQR